MKSEETNILAHWKEAASEQSLVVQTFNTYFYLGFTSYFYHFKVSLTWVRTDKHT